jgi:hypothetical protein
MQADIRGAFSDLNLPFQFRMYYWMSIRGEPHHLLDTWFYKQFKGNKG